MQNFTKEETSLKAILSECENQSLFERQPIREKYFEIWIDLCRPGIGISVTQRMQVFKPIT
jgi:hypothetical protein